MLSANLIRIRPNLMDKKLSNRKNLICGKQKVFTKHSLQSYGVKKEQRSVAMSSMHNNSTELIELSKTVGHVIISFTAIYCSLNWSLYRSIRKQIEKNNNQSDHLYDDQKEEKRETDETK
jgi:hypothetical protein